MSTHLQTALAFFRTADARDYPALSLLLADDFTHHIFPATLGGFGMPVRNKKELLENVRKLEALIESFNFQLPKEIIEAEGVVIIHLMSNGKTTAGEPYTNECMFTFRFEGEKILSIKEFMDSAYVMGVVARGSESK